MNFNEELDKAKLCVSILQAAGYKAYITGGACRVLQFGGVTSDIDIAVMCDNHDEFNSLKYDIDTLLNRVGHSFHMIHNSEYDTNTVFIADYRSGNINLIAYKDMGDGIDGLVRDFDFNINSGYLIKDEVINKEYDGYVRHNYKQRTKTTVGKFKQERYERFLKEYAHLDWSKYETVKED